MVTWMTTFLAAGAVAAQAAAGGEVNHTFWYLSRTAGLCAYVVLVVNMALGIALSMPVLERWVMKWRIFDLHQFTSLLGLGFIGLHVLTLLGDHYIGYNLAQVLVPFADAPYRPEWVALGQIGLYLLVPVTFTFYIRRQIGNRAWRVIHYLSYAVFAMALLHGLFSGTDSGNVWVSGMYWVSAASLLALTAYRLSSMVQSPRSKVQT